MKNTLLLFTLCIFSSSIAQDVIKQNTFLGTKGSNDWTPESRTTFDYQNNGDSVINLTQMHLNGSWKNFHRDYSIYNSNGNEIRKFESHWEGPDNNTGEYKNENFTETSFAWLSGFIYKHSTLKYVWNMDSTAWDTSKFTYAKIGLNSQLQTVVKADIIQLKLGNSPLQNFSSVIYGYDNLGKRVSETVEFWEDSAWVRKNYTSIQYDFTTGDQTVRTTRKYIDGTFSVIPYTKTEYSYVSMNYIDTIVVSLWDTTTKKYNYSSREIWDYNDDGYLASKTLEIYDLTNSSWYNSYKTTYEYKQTGSASNLSVDNTIKLFPNPATNYLTISTQTPHSLQIFTTDGKAVLQFNVQTNYSSTKISELKPGIYFVKISENNKHTATRRFIKK